MKNETRSNSERNETRIPLLSISLKLNDGTIVVDQVSRILGYAPQGELDTEKDVPEGIIGHWLEISDHAGKTVYRRYIQRGLPLNIENASSKLQRIYSLENYHVVVPDLPKGRQLTLFEQSIPSQGSRKPERKTRLTLGLVQSLHEMGHAS